MESSPVRETPRRNKSRASVLRLRSELQRCIDQGTPAALPSSLEPLSDLSNSPRVMPPKPTAVTHEGEAPPPPEPVELDAPPVPAEPVPPLAACVSSPCVSARRRKGQSPISAAQAIAFVSQLLAQASEAHEMVELLRSAEGEESRYETMNFLSSSLLDICASIEAQRDRWLTGNDRFAAATPRSSRPREFTPLAATDGAERSPIALGHMRGPTGTPAAALNESSHKPGSRTLACGPDEPIMSPMRPPELVSPSHETATAAGDSVMSNFAIRSFRANEYECEIAAIRLQSTMRGIETRRSMRGDIMAVQTRTAAALAFRFSEREYKRQLTMLHANFYAPLAAAGVPPTALRPIFGNVQVLLNLSDMMLAELVKQEATDTTVSPSAACARALLAMLPMFRVYQQYVSGRSEALAALNMLREGRQKGADTAHVLKDLEAAMAARTLGTDVLSAAIVQDSTATAEAASKQGGIGVPRNLEELLDAPTHRVAAYTSQLAKILDATAKASRFRAIIEQALRFSSDLVAQLDSSLAEQASRLRVSELHTELSQSLGSVLLTVVPEGLALPHRRFLCEGKLDLVQDSAEKQCELHAVYLFNDLLLLVADEVVRGDQIDGSPPVELGVHGSGGAREPRVECIGLAKVQIKVLHDLDEKGWSVTGPTTGAKAIGFFPFELWSLQRSWRLAARTEEERSRWVEAIQQQVRFLLAAFKQRGRSLAFLPQTVQSLRSKLVNLLREQRRHEAEILLLTDEMCILDANLQAGRQALTAVSFRDRRLSIAIHGLQAGPSSARQIQSLRRRVTRGTLERAELQRVANGCVEQLLTTLSALEETHDSYNDDSLIQYMLFSDT